MVHRVIWPVQVVWLPVAHGKRGRRATKQSLVVAIAHLTTATSRTSLATSTAMVVDFMQDSSLSERSATQGDSGISMPRESREESITSACRRRRAGWAVVGRRLRQARL